MKNNIILFILLLALLALTGCGNEEPPYPDSSTSEYGYEHENEEWPHFNLPTLEHESQYNFHVRYFVHAGGDGFASVRRDFYAEERAWLKENPDDLERSWRWGVFNPETRQRMVSRLRVVTTIDELTIPSLPEYTEYFFENNYLVVIELTMPNMSLDELVHQVDENGNILLRPRMTGQATYIAISRWTVVIELDIRFQPQEFNVVFIDNPWATNTDIDVPTVTTLEIEDVTPEDWYYRYVVDGLRFGILQRTNNESFRFEPERHITQGEFISMLGRLHEYGHGTIGTPGDGPCYERYIKWALEMGVVHSYRYWVLSPHELITREQMAVIVFRYINAFDLSGYFGHSYFMIMMTFSDSCDMSYWARGPIERLRLMLMTPSQNEGFVFKPHELVSHTGAMQMHARISSAIYDLVHPLRR